MKVGINIKVDVTKLEKARFFKGEKGTYCDLIAFVDLDEADQYGNNGGLKQQKGKDEQVEMPYIGNVRVFWKDEKPAAPKADDGYDEDSIPF